MLYLNVTCCKKDGNQTHICWCSSKASNSKDYRKWWQGLKFMNLPGITNEFLIIHKEFKVNHFSYPQLPSRSHSDIIGNTLLGIVWKKGKHYHSTMLLKADLACPQLSCNIDRSMIFLLSLCPFTLSIHLLCLLSPHRKYSSPVVTVLVSGDHKNSVLSHATEMPTNSKYRNPSRKRP